MRSAVEQAGDREVRFGPFRVVPSRRLIEDAGAPLRLGSRAQNMLFALIERPGEVVSKADLLSKVWPDTFVDEANLKVQVAALRRALGDGQDGRRYIVNVPGLGYSFVAPIATSSAESSAEVVASASDLPVIASRMIGRSEVVPILSDMLRRYRFVSIVGPGGIGKTTVALATAESASASRQLQIHYVDLSTVADMHLVSASVALALGVGLRSEDPVEDLIARLRDKQVLIVLDSCEHVIGQVASLGERLFTAAGAG
ncbi:MAG: winged helix-turn-helix domain-containing protein, partial [Janthinobacterium lividum]